MAKIKFEHTALLTASIAIAVGLILKKTLFTAGQEEQNAVSIAVSHAKEECSKEGLSNDVCGSITGTASVADVRTINCRGSNDCWLTHVNSKNQSEYSAGMFVKRISGKYVLSGYLRSNIPSAAIVDLRLANKTTALR